jgi:hypothetical protein
VAHVFQGAHKQMVGPDQLDEIEGIASGVLLKLLLVHFSGLLKGDAFGGSVADLPGPVQCVDKVNKGASGVRVLIVLGFADASSFTGSGL